MLLLPSAKAGEAKEAGNRILKIEALYQKR
jgi:hypothetical protein